MKTLTTNLLFLALALSPSSNAQDRAVRFSDLTEAQAQSLFKQGAPPVILEFRKGDRLPVNLSIEGDLLEGQEDRAAVTVKRSFYIKVDNGNLLGSVDGTSFKSLGDFVGGSLEAGVAGGPVNEVRINLNAKLR